jgi:hypothetical protein
MMIRRTKKQLELAYYEIYSVSDYELMNSVFSASRNPLKKNM